MLHHSVSLLSLKQFVFQFTCVMHRCVAVTMLIPVINNQEDSIWNLYICIKDKDKTKLSVKI